MGHLPSPRSFRLVAVAVELAWSEQRRCYYPGELGLVVLSVQEMAGLLPEHSETIAFMTRTCRKQGRRSSRCNSRRKSRRNSRVCASSYVFERGCCQSHGTHGPSSSAPWANFLLRNLRHRRPSTVACQSASMRLPSDLSSNCPDEGKWQRLSSLGSESHRLNDTWTCQHDWRQERRTSESLRNRIAR